MTGCRLALQAVRLARPANLKSRLGLAEILSMRTLGLDRATLRRKTRDGALAVGVVLLASSVLVVVSRALPHPMGARVVGMAAIGIAMALAGLLFIRFADRVTIGIVFAALMLTAVAVGGLAYESGVAAGQFGSILFWVVLVAALVLPRRALIACVGWVLAVSALTLIAVGHSPGYAGVTLWILFAFSLSIVTAFASVLVAQRSSADTRAQRFFDLSHDLLCTLNQDGYLVELNASWERTVGFTPDELRARPGLEFVHPEDREKTKAAVAQVFGGRNDADFQNRFRNKNGGWRWLRWSSTAMRDEGLLYARATDVTDRVEADLERERLLVELENIAQADSLTTLPNRRSLEKRLDAEIGRAERDDVSLSLAVFDLDGFKAYNDANGHLAGDQMLCRLARNWLRHVRDTDFLARWGGDEFMVVLPGCDLNFAAPIVERLRISTPIGQTCSAGLATRLPGESSDQLTHRADGALYRAKAAGRDLLALADFEAGSGPDLAQLIGNLHLEQEWVEGELLEPGG
jgi:diguanylate cyclase (GGDEF)-like protein/PAS domain S-box-containing protein